MKKFLMIMLVLFSISIAMPNCSSTGFFTFYATCPECDGSGRCQAKNCFYGYIIEEYYEEGVGAKVEHNKGPCDVCNGTGKCQKCEGSGVVLAK